MSEEKLAAPSHEYNKHNNPVWKLPAVVPVERMDNTLAMTMEVGKLSQNGEPVGSVDLAIGGFVFIVSIDDKKDKRRGGRQYAINVADLVNTVAQMDDELCQAERREPPVKKKADAAA